MKLGYRIRQRRHFFLFFYWANRRSSVIFSFYSKSLTSPQTRWWHSALVFSGHKVDEIVSHRSGCDTTGNERQNEEKPKHFRHYSIIMKKKEGGKNILEGNVFGLSIKLFYVHLHGNVKWDDRSTNRSFHFCFLSYYSFMAAVIAFLHAFPSHPVTF